MFWAALEALTSRPSRVFEVLGPPRPFKPTLSRLRFGRVWCTPVTNGWPLRVRSHYEWGAPFLVTGAVAITNGWIFDFAPELENVASGGQLAAFRAFGDVFWELPSLFTLVMVVRGVRFGCH